MTEFSHQCRSWATVEQAVDAIRAGRPVLVLDDEDRENEGDLIIAAESASSEWVGFAIRHGSGLICAPVDAAIANWLDLPLMVQKNQDQLRTAYTVTVDAAHGVTTGISAQDRARTLRVLAEAGSPDDLIRPGHVLPLRARRGGVLERAGHTEAAVDLCRLAGMAPAAGIVELVHDDGSMMRADAVLALGAEHDLPVLTIAELARWRRQHDLVNRLATTALPTEHGTFTVHGYRDQRTGAELLALVSPRGLTDRPVVRVHSECLTGDALGSLRCDCGPQLTAALDAVAREGGVVVYVRGHEGRGVGLIDKLRAYALQDDGRDTVDAQVELGLPIDAREYDAAAAVLHDLDVTTLVLLTNNPLKANALREAGLDLEIRPLRVGMNAINAKYLDTKHTRLGHLAEHLTNGAK
ncbi:3,4-dihydroxy-2-butanone-4-phosphate synthase [Demetria terragena]|uniref:3,4-dihydroxy-2-butanone-4-phosphate synthase n=1 Tax=Demetria terragena TaxID=63959 RepID=UPI00036B9009|nr:3,4-dihydroxy-2-butanone-4-phosphate synthase [Demetria terragena]